MKIIIDGVEYAPVVKTTTEVKTLSRSINIEIHPDKSESKLTWDQAQEYCKKFLGEGWRLPTISEMFYLYEDKIITENFYWSSTEYDNFLAWDFNFYDGNASSLNKYYPTYVRAVRDIKSE